MVRFLLAVVVVGGCVFLGGLITARPIRQNAAIAQNGIKEAPTIDGRAFETTRPDSPFRDADAARDTAISDLEESLDTPNRFDRGRLDEVFDGPTHRGTLHHQPRIAELATAEAPRVLERESEISPPSPLQKQRPKIDEGHAFDLPPSLDLDASPFPHKPRSVNNDLANHQANRLRVTILRWPDHTKITPAADSQKDSKLLPIGAIKITAEEFTLAPATEPGVGNMITCTGRVEICGENFIASGTKLSVKNSDIILEGTPDRPAEITKMPAVIEGADAVASPPGPEFHLAARQISFNLSLSTIKVSNNVEIVPADATSAKTGSVTTPQPAVGTVPLDEDSNVKDVAAPAPNIDAPQPNLDAPPPAPTAPPPSAPAPSRPQSLDEDKAT